MVPSSTPFSFSAAAARTPNALAVITEDRSYCWSELLPVVSAACRTMRQAGVSAGDAIAVPAERTLKSLILIYAALEHRLTIVPMRPESTMPMRPRSTVPMRTRSTGPSQDMLAQAKRFWVQAHGASEDAKTRELQRDKLTEALGVSWRPVERKPPSEQPTGENETNLSYTNHPHTSHSPLLAIPTSGSTGEAKLVLLSADAVEAAVCASARHLGWLRRDRLLLCLPLFHVGGLSVLLRSLHAAKPLVLYPEGSFDGERCAQLIDRQSVTMTSLVPTMVHRLLQLPRWTAPQSLRAVLVGGAYFGTQAQREALARSIPTLRTYGMTETFGQVATQTLAQARLHQRGAGRALQGTQFRLRDGKVEIRSPQLFSGYACGNRVLAPVLRDGFFRSDDFGELSDGGELSILGRGTDFAICGGENVDLHQLDEAFAAHFGLGRVCSVALPHAEWGQVIALVIRDCDPLQPAALTSFARQNLAPHERPQHIVRVHQFPLTASGKVSRAELGKTAAQATVLKA